MASAISPLSYLDTSIYQSLTPSTSASAAGASSAVSPTAEMQAMAKQGNFQAFINDSMAVALLLPSDGSSTGTDANTLINNMLQQVLGAYQTPTAPVTGTTAVG
jgi:hypothetical protein